MSDDPEYERAERIASHMLMCAGIVYNRRIKPPKIIDQIMTWNVGAFTVMLNTENEEVLVSGGAWELVLKPGGQISLTGKIAGDVQNAHMAITYRELLTLVVALCTTPQELQVGETHVRVYASEPSGREIEPESTY
jgi:hypothetical protein